MLPGYVSQTGIGRSPIWFPDRFQDPFSIGVGCTLLSGAATFNIEHSFEGTDLIIQIPWAVPAGQTRIYLPNLPSAPIMAIGRPVVDLTTSAAIPAGATVTAFDASSITLSAAVAGGGILAGDRISFLSWQILAGITGATANATGAYSAPVRALSLNITAGTGTVIAEFIQASNAP